MITPEIIFKDPNFLVLNKPSGMIVNNADTSKGEYTVQDFVMEEFKIKADYESEFYKRGGIVHRLDKETSGILIVALNEDSFSNLQKQFKEREVEKEYVALCHGSISEEGQINVPLGRLPWNRKRFGVIPSGREASTQFKLIKKYFLKDGRKKEILSLIQVFPKTGRTHQIRVHMQYVGYPIFADSLYAGRKAFQNDRKFLSRHFLHASRIIFKSPTTGERVEFEAPIGNELTNFLSLLTTINN